jgi:hypothetical protein
MVDLVGERFGRLVVRAEAFTKPNGKYWHCVCDCGNRTITTTGHLWRQGEHSCGCWKIENSARRMREYRAQCEVEPHLKHGHFVNRKMTATYQTWHMMIQRCTNPKRSDYERYGGRGITVCKRWRDSFEAFLVDMGERPKGLTLDRKNNDGPYTKRNCRWATPSQQEKNKRRRT